MKIKCGFLQSANLLIMRRFVHVCLRLSVFAEGCPSLFNFARNYPVVAGAGYSEWDHSLPLVRHPPYSHGSAVLNKTRDLARHQLMNLPQPWTDGAGKFRLYLTAGRPEDEA